MANLINFTKKYLKGRMKDILNLKTFSKSDIIRLLELEGEEMKELFAASSEVRSEYCGNKVYFRGLIEYSNSCRKSCLYCGIRCANPYFTRYTLSDDEVMESANFALRENFGSLVIQSGENNSKAFILKIERLVRKIKQMSDGKLGITLSLGEQTEDTYKRWFDAGAHRYLLRIEASDPSLYKRLHPDDGIHNYADRIRALELLKKTGYQLGTGVMIGLPFQNTGHLADDLLFMKNFDIDMCGMGPYVEHRHTPLYSLSNQLPALNERINLSFKMIALLRLMMKDINIASTTALQAIDPEGRTFALKIGANILMPNITPSMYRDQYNLYENKPGTDESPADSKESLMKIVLDAGCEPVFDEWGDSKHYKNRNEHV